MRFYAIVFTEERLMELILKAIVPLIGLFIIINLIGHPSTVIDWVSGVAHQIWSSISGQIGAGTS
jgi:hypothetical protein